MSTSSLKPYLELRHYLSLTWLAYPILSLLFVAFRLQLSLDSAQDSIASAKDNLIASCKAAERAATSAASMPRIMALATNEQFADTVNASLNAARAALVLSLTVMEAIINFIIDIYRSTFLCFLELVIRGGLAIIIGAVKEISDLLEKAVSGLGTTIQNQVNDANGVIKGAIDAINKVNPFSDISVPQIPVPNLDSLKNFQFPTTLEDSLNKLNSTIPTFNDIKEKLEQLVDTPFELLKKDINDTFSGISFDRSVLPVPAQNTLTFCNDLDTSIVDDLGRDLIKIAKIGVIIIIVLALILVALNCLLEWYKWRCQTRNMEYTREAWTTDRTVSYSGGASQPQVTLSNHNLLMLHAMTSHPLIARITNQLSNRLNLSALAQIRTSWYLNYIFHGPALACFMIGFFGILSVQIQLAALSPLTAKYAEKETAAVTDFSNTIFASVNDSMYNQSATYANDVNGRVDSMQSTINQGVFGWVNGTTTTINSTINEVYNDIQNAVNTVFNGTILEQPAQEFIRCLIGSKVDAIENALTFLHDNLKVDIPRMNQSVLVLSQGSVDEATKPIALAAVGDGSDSESGGIVGKLVNAYANSLRKERIMFLIFLGLWGFVCLMGIGWIIWESRRGRKETGSPGISPYTVSYPQQADGEKGTGYGGGLKALTPLSSRASTPSSEREEPKSFFAGFAGLKKSAPTTEPEERERKRTISGPVKLKAFSGRFGKARREPSLVADEPSSPPPPMPMPMPEPETDQPKQGWFGRFFGKKDEEKPDARRTSSILSLNPTHPTSQNNPDRSRWSASPPASPTSPNPFSPTSQATPWVAISSPRGKTFNVTAPSELLAPPIHHGYGYPSNSSSSSHPFPPPPPPPHPEPSPVSRLLSANPARRSSSSGLNPFATPFDDEHRVKVQPGVQRKSVPAELFVEHYPPAGWGVTVV
ncbi:plasma membrane fusion protein prm1 [Marasmius crinis-equi]|uniref:Plasma membrane fusion protein PRM1 n=1 Tax=Marasmius crinis-equi TaxID=585013 RepID=A0ABR3ES61_9AGAR